MPARINALHDQHIRAILNSLDGGSDVADLHEDLGRGIEGLERRDDGPVRLDVAVGRKEPDCCGLVLLDDGQGCFFEVSDRGVTRDEARADLEGVGGVSEEVSCLF